MQDAPDVDLAFPLDVEDEVWEPSEWPCAQLGEFELVGEPERPAVWVASDLLEGTLDGIDEATSDLPARHADVVIDDNLYVVGGQAAEPDRLGHQVVSPSCRGGREAW